MKAPLSTDRVAVERTAAGGWRYTDAVYNPRWLARVTKQVVKVDTGCWLWTGFKNWKGYAAAQYRGNSVNVHRYVYMLTRNVRLKKEQFVCHTCDVRHCINPNHLWMGTNSDNQRDASRKGRHQEKKRTHCPKGHAYTPENTYYKPLSSGRLAGARMCKECCRERGRRYWRENPERMRQRLRNYRLRKKQEAHA